ncbi:MAG: glycosyl hydrolase family 28-related protein, partial [Planctomycetota bacterium]
MQRKTSESDFSKATLAGLITTILLAVVAAPHLTAGAEDVTYSRLWGRDGELWSPTSRLPDFSYAGYHRSEHPLPSLSANLNIRDFGAVGDGETDDTEAFKRALSRRSRGKTIFVPAGRYLITDFLYMRYSGTSLLGESPEESVLFFPTPLHTIKPNMGATTTGQPTSNYSWSGGFVYIEGSTSQNVLAEVIAEAKRGQNSLTVSRPQAFQIGQDVRLSLRDNDEQSLANYLYADDPGPIQNLKSRARVSFLCRIVKIDTDTKQIEFDRPLRTDVRHEWAPRLYDASCSVEDVGIMNLGFEFPVTPYEGHFTELGYNAIAMRGVRNCWVQNVRIHNSDSGMFISGNNITLRQISLTSERPREQQRNATGHHGITIGGQDNLLDDFQFETRFMHDITVTSGSAGNVAASGSGVDICFDHHRYAPHANLFTDIDLGEGSRMFQSGGGAALGRHSA